LILIEIENQQRFGKLPESNEGSKTTGK